LDKYLENKYQLNKLLNLIYYLIVINLAINSVSLGIPSRSWWWKAPRFIGFFTEPNHLGAFFMLSYPIMLWKYYSINTSQHCKRILILFLVLTLTLHALTASRTTIISSIIGILVFFSIKRKTTKIFTIVSLVILLTVFVFFVFTPENLSRGDDSSTLTITGRDVLWNGAIIRFFQSPYFGYGYMVESKILNLLSMQGTFSQDSAQQPLHNGYLSILTGTGIVGFILWMLIILTPFLKIAKNRRQDLIDYKAYCISTAVMVLISNFTESFLTGYIGNGGDLFFWFAWIVALKIYEFTKFENILN
jgi:O-antigen ligase